MIALKMAHVFYLWAIFSTIPCSWYSSWLMFFIYEPSSAAYPALGIHLGSCFLFMSHLQQHTLLLVFTLAHVFYL